MTDWERFDQKSTADEIAAEVDLSGKLAIVTGANTGIGFEAARALAAAGCRVVFACRNQTAGEGAVARTVAQHPGAQAEYAQLDLASLASVREFAARASGEKIDILVCNAGLINKQYEEDQQGFELTVGVCHVGHFLLTTLLLPQILADGGGRVVMVSSESHRMPKQLAFDKLPLTADNFSILESYGQAKLCNVLFANELHRRYFDEGLSACSLHPGNLVTTDIGRGSLLMRIGMMLVSPFTKSASQGASTTVLCAVHPDPAAVSGHYFSHCQVARASREGENPEVAKRLWELSEGWISA